MSPSYTLEDIVAFSEVEEMDIQLISVTVITSSARWLRLSRPLKSVIKVTELLL